MWFRARFNSQKSRPAATGGRRSSSRPTSRLQVEALEDRSVPALIADPVGDVLPGYTGPRDPGLDVTAHEAVYLADEGRVVFFGRMAGPIAPTGALGGLYIIGVDRGSGTPRFAGRTPVIGPNALSDPVVRVHPD